MGLSRDQKIAILAFVVPAIIAGIAIYVNYMSQPPLDPDFEISVNPMSGSVQQGGATQMTITVKSINGYNHDVSLSPIGNPTGMIVNPIPPSDRPRPAYASNVIITVTSVVPEGDYPIVIKGTGADGTEHTCTYTLTVKPLNSPTHVEDPSPTPPPTINIVFPLNGSSASQYVTAQGTAQNIPSRQVIWAIVYVRNISLYYPMPAAVIVEPNGSWQTPVTIGGPNDTGLQFDIIMVVANQTGQASLAAYNEDAEKNHPGNYPGIPQLPEGVIEYSRVTVIRLPWTP